MTPTEIDDLFYFDPAAPRMVGYATNASIARDKTARAVLACAELLDRQDKAPSGKWLWLQIQPEDALKFAATILALAIEEQWPIRPDFLEMVERIQLSGKSQKH